MAAEIQKQLGVQAELIPGGGGIFDVAVDGELIFSKFEQSRFPKPTEVISALRKRS